MEVAPMLGKIFERFVEKSPVSVMARGLLERVLNPKTIDEIFERVADRQYTRNLLFSVVFDLMSQVVCGSRKTLHAAYQASPQKISVSVTSVYNKVDGIETQTSASLVRYCADAVTPVIDQIGGALPPLLPGYRIKILDGNCLEATEHRLRQLRGTSAGPLPGKSLVVLDPSLKLMLDVFPCEDGHTQERALLEQVLPTVEAKDCWIEDRNFCTINFSFTVDKRDAFFIVRQHQNLPWEPVDKLRKVGRIDGAKVSEQSIVVWDHEGNELRLRRIRIHLDTPTRDGDRDVFVLTNLPKKVRATKIATLYRNRWKIETAFQELANHLNSEINTLGYPKAALFAFCVALIAYNVMSVIQAALRSVHGATVVEQNVSGYYIAEELSSVYQGMMIAIPERHWPIFSRMSVQEFSETLRRLASKVNLRRFKKHPRGPKKPQPKRIFDKNHPHVSTFRLIAARKSSGQ
jgi:IS4 transposase